LYLPARQAELRSLTFYARHSGEPGQLRTVIPALVARADPNLPVERLRTMDEQIWDNVTRDRVLATLSTWFAALATILAAVGLYAVLAYTVAQRLREIGIRVALGAPSRSVMRQVLLEALRVAALGTAVGLVAALPAARLLRSQLFGVGPGDPATFVLVALVLVAVAVVAAFAPARRATRVDPMVALRAE
jgi:ABC-type antimicrobial peptide transport system permease subunit